MERAHRRDEPERVGAGELGCRADDLHRARRLREHVVERLEVRPDAADRLAVRLDGLPVAALDRAGQLEAVLDRAPHQRLERLRRRAGCREELGRDPVQRDEVVRGDRGARVVERPRVVGELERPQAEQLRELEAERAGLVGLGGDRRPGAVELLGPARARERLQRVEREAPLVRVERRERRRAADVRDPAVSRGQSPGHVPNGRVRHAEQRQLAVLAQGDAALLEPSGQRRADAAATDHVHAFDHLKLQLRSGCRAREV